MSGLPTWHPDLSKKVEKDESGQEVPKISPITGEQEDPLGFLGRFPAIAEPLRRPANWLSLIGAIGVIIAFGHSILAMSGEETLAQVYREVESPKLANFKRAAFIVFLYSFLLTGSMSLLAVLLIPDEQRMGEYHDNWIGGLAMQMVGPLEALLLLNAFVVVVGFLILSGGGQHLDYRFQWRAEPGGGGRRVTRLVPPAAPAVRHHFPHPLPHHRLAVVHDHRQPRRRDCPG